MSFELLYRDEQLLALNKPSGLLSVLGLGPENQDCLASRVAEQFPTAQIVHRIDRDTSGVIVMALDADTHRELSRQFHDREVDKTYVAVVYGSLAEDSGEIDLPMRKDFDHKPRHCIDPVHGRPAITRWRVVERLVDRTRLELVPLTGRSHQLRLHLATIGHPILGDNLYAHAAAHAMASRLMLHARSLTITHPTSGERLTFTAGCPF
jgi:tRNA pseudouridine32 synthase/23S rRNA pseudouridine746 synthase